MKMRLGVITSDRAEALKVREGFADVLVVPAKNVIELYQVNGAQPLQGIIFIDSGDLKKEFKSYHSFIRSKHGFAETPILLIGKDEGLQIDGVTADPLVRSFSSKEGVFLPLLSFMNVIKKTEGLKEVLAQDYIQSEFRAALTERLGQSSDFQSREATDDEVHSSFFSQKGGEISSNLVWIKFSVRILDEGSKGLKETFKTFSESEIEETTEKILDMVLSQFQNKLKEVLRERGALFLPSVDNISPQDRNILVKGSTSQFIMFESPACSVLLEEIRYL